ncbi:hypothetical protein ACGVWS_09915 [Enterobacteriaceae bacterium LUAb1]
MLNQDLINIFTRLVTDGKITKYINTSQRPNITNLIFIASAFESIPHQHLKLMGFIPAPSRPLGQIHLILDQHQIHPDLVIYHNHIRRFLSETPILQENIQHPTPFNKKRRVHFAPGPHLQTSQIYELLPEERNFKINCINEINASMPQNLREREIERRNAQYLQQSPGNHYTKYTRHK